MMARGMYAGSLFNDRFSISFMLALVLHAAVLLGLGFALDFKPLKKAADTLDVVLVNFQSETPPEDADFLAQASQRGGGEEGLPEKPASELSSTSPVETEGDMPFSAMEQLPAPAQAELETLTTQDEDALPAPDVTSVEQPDAVMPSAAQLMQQSMLADRMQPEAQREAPWRSRMKRRKYISANTREYEFAAYMQAWVAKVERVGNLNYPVELRQRGLSGDLLMTVGINRDGSVESINLARGSGIDELDQAAMRIVRLAGPYAPLPPEVTEEVDVLHITRTWRFSNNSRFDTR
jgi:protein TonB